MDFEDTYALMSLNIFGFAAGIALRLADRPLVQGCQRCASPSRQRHDDAMAVSQKRSRDRSFKIITIQVKAHELNSWYSRQMKAERI